MKTKLKKSDAIIPRKLLDYERTPDAEELKQIEAYRRRLPKMSKRQTRLAVQEHFHIRKIF